MKRPVSHQNWELHYNTLRGLHALFVSIAVGRFLHLTMTKRYLIRRIFNRRKTPKNFTPYAQILISFLVRLFVYNNL